jgi:uncharacterized membrane-anchored protein
MTKKTISTLARRTQNPIFAIALGGMLAVMVCPRGYAQDASEFRQIAWEHGPTAVQVGEQAKISLPDGFMFTHEAGARKFLELTQNPPSGRELGILAPADLSWFAIVSFSDVGYVRDEEKDSLDADAMLASIQHGTEEENQERKRRGWSAISVIGWMQSPHYDSGTHNLEWSLKGREQEGDVVINHFTRFLGGEG